MCGRFNLSYSTSDVSVKLPNVLWDFDQAPNFNIAPSQQISVVSELKGVFTGSIMQWGIPITTSDGKTALMSNTRIERILHKNKWNKSAIEADDKFLADQDKIEPAEASETQANQ